MKKILFFSFSLLLLACTKEIDSSKTSTTPTVPGGSTGDTTKTGGGVVTTASITSLDCGNAQVSGKLQKGVSASAVSLMVSYLGGNGKTYNSQTISSAGVTGLTATLQAGTLENGNGTLAYTISGTPTTAGTASFGISLGGKSCSIILTVEDVVQLIGKPSSNITDVDGNSYKTVTIGTQTWMAENLKVSKYSDGIAIPNITDNTQWSNLTTGAFSYFNNDAANNSKYGKLYNWYAVSKTTNDNKNVCPTGWHVPTDAEWTVLTDYLGGVNVAGGKMKEVGTTNWNSSNIDATNTSLFTGLPGGSRFSSGIYIYDDVGDVGRWWSSTESTEFNTNSAWSRYLYHSIGIAKSVYDSKREGLSVRCLRD